MRYLTSLFLTLLFTHNVLADNLCDASCELTITFPDGGAIEATEALTITFGEGGILNLGVTGTVNVNPQPANIDFSAGGTLSLVQGESITFGDNGSITLGVGGNINYSSMLINSTGGAAIKAVGGTGTITIANLVISGGLNITFDAITIVINGSINIEPDGTLNLIADTGAIEPSVCTIQDSAAGTLTLTGSTPIVTASTCNTIAGVLTLPAGTLTVGIIDPNATLTNTGTIVNTGTITQTVSNVGPLQVTTLTQEFLAALPDGAQFSTEDGNTCTLTAGECVTATGAKYVVVDGKLVLPAEGSGMVNLASLSTLFTLLIMFRFLDFARRPFR